MKKANSFYLVMAKDEMEFMLHKMDGMLPPQILVRLQLKEQKTLQTSTK
jgi:hypothetical protein